MCINEEEPQLFLALFLPQYQSFTLSCTLSTFLFFTLRQGLSKLLRLVSNFILSYLTLPECQDYRPVLSHLVPRSLSSNLGPFCSKHKCVLQSDQPCSKTDKKLNTGCGCNSAVGCLLAYTRPQVRFPAGRGEDKHFSK